MNRKQRRALKKIAKNEEATSSIELMLGVADCCLTCKKVFDKLSKEMTMTWFVEVYKLEKRVDLYCPDCYKPRT